MEKQNIEVILGCTVSSRPVLGYRVRPCFDQIEKGEGGDVVVEDEEGVEGTNP